MSSDSSTFPGTIAATRIPARGPTRPRVQRQPDLALPLLRRMTFKTPLHEQGSDVRLKERDARAVIRGERKPAHGEEGESEEAA